MRFAPESLRRRCHVRAERLCQDEEDDDVESELRERVRGHQNFSAGRGVHEINEQARGYEPARI
jgi:hypothetical protein